MKNIKIYKERFSNLEQRKNIWKILTEGFFQKFIDKNDTTLDFGCGYCEFINNIRCKRKFATDSDKSFSKYAAKDVTFISSKANKINLPKNSIDKIFISNVFEHLTKNEITQVIEEFSRLLKKDGQVIILQPNIRFCYKDYWMFFDHITPVDDRMLYEVFSIFDFKLKYKILKFLPFTTKSNFPQNKFFIKTYLSFPILWTLFGKQSLLIFKK